MAVFELGWLFFSVVAYFFNAVAVILDKFLLSRRVQRPSTYAFWVGALGLFSFALVPFGFFVPPRVVIVQAFISGIAFMYALFAFYIAIQAGEASRVTPIIGALSPIFVFFFSHRILGETLNGKELIAFVVLVAGSVLVSMTHRKDGTRLQGGDIRIYGWAVFAALLFGITYVYEKAVFNSTPFINGFIWMRLGGFIGILPLLFFSGTREYIYETPEEVGWKTIAIFIGNKMIGAAGSFLLAAAIFFAASVSLVNALQGVQYALVFLIALFLSRAHPFVLEEEFTPLAVFEKAAAIALVGGGLALLAFSSA